MSRHALRVFVALGALLAFGLGSDGARAAPAGLPETPLDLELKEASVVHVFRLLGDVAHREVVLDPCVKGGVDLRLQNTPLPLVFDALALKLGLIYETDGDVIKVRCRDADAASGGGDRLLERVSVVERSQPLPDVLQRLAVTAKLDGVDYRASARPTVNVTLESVRLTTAVAALSETTNLAIKVSQKRLVVTDVR
jgi:hypothetical protein